MSLPRFPLETRDTPRGRLVWDGIRRLWLTLTAEEQVRQCLVRYLTEFCGVPSGLMSLEKGLRYDRRKKRYDLLVFDRTGKPLILCECKTPRNRIDDAVFHQISTYNSKINARIILLTNGHQLIAYARLADGRWKGLALPDPELPGGTTWFVEAEREFAGP
jgi:Type I restriction enzyme R protein N terminus (HSDR_N)